jgi:hypothetical protein
MDIIENHQTTYAKINRDLKRLSTWAKTWLVTFNANKTVYLQVSRKLNPAPKPILKLNGIQIKEVLTHKHLGLTFNNSFTWSDHIGNLVTKAAKCVGLLRKICRTIPRNCIEILYNSMILPIMEYCDVIYDGSADTHLDRLENVQRQAALTCTGAYRHTNHDTLLDELGWPLLSVRRKHHRLNLMYKIQNGLSPQYLIGACPVLTRERTNYDLRTGMNITNPLLRTTTYQKSFFPQTISDWYSLKLSIRNSPSISSFKDTLRKSTGKKSNSLFQYGNTTAAINHTRMRLGLSGLSSHRCNYKHIPYPKCMTCNAPNEDPQHYFLLCPTYSGPRPNFLLKTCDIMFNNNVEIDFTRRLFREFFINAILRGSNQFEPATNLEIFKLTQEFIKESHRFP